MLSSSDESEDDKNLSVVKVNKKYALKFEKEERFKELQKKESKQILEDGDDDDSTSTSEDEEGEALTTELDIQVNYEYGRFSVLIFDELLDYEDNKEYS